MNLIKGSLILSFKTSVKIFDLSSLSKESLLKIFVKFLSSTAANKFLSIMKYSSIMPCSLAFLNNAFAYGLAVVNSSDISVLNFVY